MNIDRTTIAVRERGLFELFDLALLVGRRHFWQILALMVVSTAPFIAFNWWLLSGRELDQWWTWYPLLLLLAVQSPFATAPLTAYLGTALFDQHPRIGVALRQALATWWQLLLIGLYRGLLSLLPLLLVLSPPHAVEVAMLERGRLRATWRRANALREVWTGEWILHLLVVAPLFVIGVTSLIDAVLMVSSVLAHAEVAYPDEHWRHFNPGSSLAPHVAAWVMLTYLAVVRFLSYIDLRTRREGWAVDLALRRAAERLEPGT